MELQIHTFGFGREPVPAAPPVFLNWYRTRKRGFTSTFMKASAASASGTSDTSEAVTAAPALGLATPAPPPAPPPPRRPQLDDDLSPAEEESLSSRPYHTMPCHTMPVCVSATVHTPARRGGCTGSDPGLTRGMATLNRVCERGSRCTSRAFE